MKFLNELRKFSHLHLKIIELDRVNRIDETINIPSIQNFPVRHVLR